MKRGVRDEATLEDVLELAEEMITIDGFDTWRAENTDERIERDIEEADGYQTMHDWEQDILDFVKNNHLYLNDKYWDILNEEDEGKASLYQHKFVDAWANLNSSSAPRMRLELPGSYKNATCLNCAVSDVKVPGDFARSQERAFDLVNIVQNELWDRGMEAIIKQLYRPKSDIFRFSFVITDPNTTDEQVDAAIEGVVDNIVRSGFTPDVSVDSALTFDDDRVPSGRYWEPGWEDANEYPDEDLIKTDDSPLWDMEFADNSVDPFDEEEHPEDDTEEEDIFADDDDVFAADDPDDGVDTFNYMGYTITGSPKVGYACLSPYGKWAPDVFKRKADAMEAVKQDVIARYSKK